MGTRYNHLAEAVLTSIHNLCFLSRNKKNNKYLQSMFLSRNKKNNVYPCKTEVGNILSWRLITVILSLPLIQEEQLSVSSERMCTILVNRLED